MTTTSMRMQTKNLFFDLPESLRQCIYEFDPTYKSIYNTSLKDISIGVRILQILLRQTYKLHPTMRNVLDYFHEEYKYKFQGIEYSTIKYFDFTDHIIDVNPHLNEIDNENGLGIYIYCKCKFVTQENKIIFLAFLFEGVGYYTFNNEPCQYDASSIHIFPCEEYNGFPRINMNTYFWSNLIMRNGLPSVEIVRSENNEKFETTSMFSAETMLFISNR